MIRTWTDNKVRELATACLPWQHWTKALVWFHDVDISAFHRCVVVDLLSDLVHYLSCLQMTSGINVHRKSMALKMFIYAFKKNSLQKTQQLSPASYRITYLNVPGKSTDTDINSAAET